MKGFHVKRKAGWDTHGLPVELGVRHFGFGILDRKKGCCCEILDITIATRLIQFMRAESSAGTWRIWLDCITFVKIALVIKLFEQPPYRLNISVVVNTALCVGPKFEYVAIRTYNPYTAEKITVVMASDLVGSYFKKEGETLSLSSHTLRHDFHIHPHLHISQRIQARDPL